MEKSINIAYLLLFHGGMWAGYLSVMIPRFRTGDPIAMTLDNVSWMVVQTDIGNILGPIPVGYLMDRFGRLVVLRLTFTTLLVAVSLILLATTPYHMYLAALLVGVGVGIGFTITVLYVSEIAKPKIRGSLGSIGGVMYATGTAIIMTFGPYLSFESLTWGTLVFPLMGFVLTFFIVESPHYYFIQNNETYAAEALSRVRNNSKINEKHVELESIRKRVGDDLKDKGDLLALMSQKSNKRALMIASVLGMIRAAGGFMCISIFSSTTLPVHSHWRSHTSMILFSWLNVISSILGLSLVDRFGRKPLLIISLAGLCSSSAILALFYYVYQKTSVDVSRLTFIPHVGILVFGMFYQIGVGIVPQIYRGELFPVSIKGSASAIVQILTSVMFFINNKAYFAVDQSIGIYFMYVIFLTVNFISIIFSITCVFETKGKTLDEIQKLLSR